MKLSPETIESRRRDRAAWSAGYLPEKWLANFWKRVDKDGPLWQGSPCWVWAGGVSQGYGIVRLPYGVMILTHRVTYTLIRGPIPSRLQLDHLCRNRRCCNPDHLEAVTRRVNLIRGIGFAAVNAAKTHCIHGHEFTPENTYYYVKGRACRQCQRARQRAYRAAKLMLPLGL